MIVISIVCNQNIAITAENSFCLAQVVAQLLDLKTRVFG